MDSEQLFAAIRAGDLATVDRIVGGRAGQRPWPAAPWG